MRIIDKMRFVDPYLWPAVGAATALIFAPEAIQIWLKLKLGPHAADAIYNVSASIVAAFVFYIFLDVSRRLREVRTVAPYVSRLVRSLQGDIMAVCIEAARADGTRLPAEWKFNEADIERIFARTDPRHPANMQFYDGRTATIYDYIFIGLREQKPPSIRSCL